MLVETGTQWLGKIPEHWELSKIGHCFKHRNETVSDKEFQPLSVTKNGVLPQLETAAKSDNSDGRKLIRKGDFVINQRSDRKGSAGVSPMDGSCSVIYTVLEPLKYEPRYAHHLFRSAAFQEEFYRWGTGIVDDLWSTRYSLMRQIVCPVPPLEEQRAIADYLDKELGVLDRLLEGLRDLSTLIPIRWKSLINELLTEGTNSQQFVGEKQWQTKPLGKLARLVELKGSSTFAISLENIQSHTGELQDQFEFDETSSGTRFNKGDVLFGKLRPYLGKAIVAKNNGVAVGDIHVYRTTELVPDFLKYWLLSPETLDLINSSTYGTKMPRANWEQIKVLRVQYPTLEDQTRIVHQLNSYLLKNRKLMESISTFEQVISERKVALISAAVTGKLNIGGQVNG